MNCSMKRNCTFFFFLLLLFYHVIQCKFECSKYWNKNIYPLTSVQESEKLLDNTPIWTQRQQVVNNVELGHACHHELSLHPFKLDKCRGRPITTLPVTLYQMTWKTPTWEAKWSRIEDLKELCNITNDRNRWRKLVRKIWKTANAVRSGDLDSRRSSFKFKSISYDFSFLSHTLYSFMFIPPWMWRRQPLVE